MKKNSSGIFVNFPEEIPGDSGWTLLTNNTAALQRGTPTYIRLYFSHRRHAPADAKIQNVTFKYTYSIASQTPEITDSRTDTSWFTSLSSIETTSPPEITTTVSATETTSFPKVSTSSPAIETTSSQEAITSSPQIADITPGWTISILVITSLVILITKKFLIRLKQ